MYGFGDYGVDTTGFDRMFKYNYPHYTPYGGGYATNNLTYAPSKDVFLGPKKKETPLWKTVLSVGTPIVALGLLGAFLKKKFGMPKVNLK